MSVSDFVTKAADWAKDLGGLAKDTAELVLEEGWVRDLAEDLGQTGGVAGVLFKIGARALPQATPEQRLIAGIHQAFLKGLQQELVQGQHAISRETWKQYSRERLPALAEQRVSTKFDWLQVLGHREVRSPRNWQLVNELADLGGEWIAGAAALQAGTAVSREYAGRVRGTLFETLEKAAEKLLEDDAIQKALRSRRPGSVRESLDVLATHFASLAHYRIFDEIPQSALYVSPRVRLQQMPAPQAEPDWEEIEVREHGEEVLCNLLADSANRVIIFEGEMGVGKSSLMRVAASRLAEQYLRDRRRVPVMVAWQDIYQEKHLATAIAAELARPQQLPLGDLQGESNVIFLIDGFDEMGSHDPGYVRERFEDILELADTAGCTVVLSMRSSVVTDGICRLEARRGAQVLRLEPFDDEAVEEWARNWREAVQDPSVTGERLLEVAPETQSGDSIAHNPLLLYLVARFVLPDWKEYSFTPSAAEVMRICVDKTLRGKLDVGSDKLHPGSESFAPRDYRLWLQEAAWVASWPKHAPKCVVHSLQEVTGRTAIPNLRSAFVLYFFNPSTLRDSEFEFHPEAFRHYLMAEWCVRTQLDALLNEYQPDHPLGRTRTEAMNALAQVPPRNEERRLVIEIYTGLAEAATRGGAALTEWLAALGVGRPVRDPLGLIERLRKRVTDHTNHLPLVPLSDRQVGVPDGQELPPGLNPFRLLVNYWDQCFLAAASLREPATPCPIQRDALVRLMHGATLVRGGLDLAGANLDGAHLSGAYLPGASLEGADLAGADLEGADLSGADLRGADLTGAHLEGAYVSGADLRRADLGGADLGGADLGGAYLGGADLGGADLRRADLEGADLEGADLEGADLRGANLRGANLRGANLRGANLRGADLKGASYNELTQWPDNFDPVAAGALLAHAGEPGDDEPEWEEDDDQPGLPA